MYFKFDILAYLSVYRQDFLEKLLMDFHNIFIHFHKDMGFDAGNSRLDFENDPQIGIMWFCGVCAPFSIFVVMNRVKMAGDIQMTLVMFCKACCVGSRC